MSVNTLTIEGITFPKFHKNSSKRNFRLIFYIAYKDAGEKPFVLRGVKKGDEKDKNGIYGVIIGFE